MNRYEVVDGDHVQEGKTYSKGDVVTDHRDLVKLLPGKFRLIGPAKEEVPIGIVSSRIAPAPATVTETDGEDEKEEDAKPKHPAQKASTKSNRKW